MKLTHHLLLHLFGWSLACAVLATAFVAQRAERRLQRDALVLANSAVRVLDMQLTRIALGAEHDAQFPDWGLVEGLRVPAGGCLRLRRPDGEVWRSHCRGLDVARSAPAPAWFTALRACLPGVTTTLSRPLRSTGTAPAHIEVMLDAREQVALAWRSMRDTALLVAGVAAALGAVVLIVVTRALRPARALLARIDSLERGALTEPPGRYRYVELQRIGDALERLANSLADALGRQRRLAAELLHAQENERRRLARELHDEFGQSLAGIAAMTAALRSDVAAGRVPPPADLRRLADAAAGMQAQLRELLDRLGPAALDDLGLGPALVSLADEWDARCRGRPRFVCDIDASLPDTLPAAVAITAYRTAQEALTNAARHAGAAQVALRVAPTPLGADPGLVLTVEDDGDAAPAAPIPGHGLSGMRERALALGGTVSWGRNATGGFRVEALLPIGQAPSA
ncbi:MAG: sensor histidine kinase [Gammaproteobacteria bacterium]